MESHGRINADAARDGSKTPRENELDQNATMVETFAVTQGGETIYGGQVKSL